jgi:hypothetical protein
MISNHIFRYTLQIDSFKLDLVIAPTTVESEQSAPSISVLRAIREFLRMRVRVTLCPPTKQQVILKTLEANGWNIPVPPSPWV